MWQLPQDNGTSALTTHQLQVERRESHRVEPREGQESAYTYLKKHADM